VRPSVVLFLVSAMLVGSLALATPARADTPGPRVAVIVGPVGEELTPIYIALAEAAAHAAESHGAGGGGGGGA
jgi:hypothetical protein